MRPEEYDIMVEKLADEIIGDVFEKEAAAKSDRIADYENFYSTNKSARKLINAELDRKELHENRATIRDKIKKAKVNRDDEALEAARKEKSENTAKRIANWGTRNNPITNMKANFGANMARPGTMAARALLANPTLGLSARIGYNDQEVGLERAKDAIRKERAQKTAEEMIMEYAFEKEASLKDVIKDAKAKSREKAYEKMVNDPNSPLYSAPTGKAKATYSTPVDYKNTIKDNAAEVGKFIKKHPYGTAAAVAIPTAAGVGLVAYKHHKKKKEEEAKEKVAAYWEDAMMWKEAAENVWAYASECEDEYDAELLKNAAEEVFDEAEAQAQAAENIFEAIENGELDVVGDADVIDNEELGEDYE